MSLPQMFVKGLEEVDQMIRQQSRKCISRALHETSCIVHVLYSYIDEVFSSFLIWIYYDIVGSSFSIRQ